MIRVPGPATCAGSRRARSRLPTRVPPPRSRRSRFRRRRRTRSVSSRRGDAARPCDELAAAVRADVVHRLGARDAEGALERADLRLAVSDQSITATLARGAHLEAHELLLRRLVQVENGEEGLLRHLDAADVLHALLALLLLLEQLPLAGDVTSIALREHVLAARRDRLPRDDPRADRRLDRDVEHLPRDLLAQPFHECFAALEREVA